MSEPSEWALDRAERLLRDMENSAIVHVQFGHEAEQHIARALDAARREAIEARAAKRLALDKLYEAGRRIEDIHGIPGGSGSPERRQWIETTTLIWGAMTLLDPYGSHPEDRDQAMAAIHALIDKETDR